MSFFSPPKIVLIAFFVSMMCVSHIMLPAMGKANWGPFFDWRLFDTYLDEDHYDLELRRGPRLFMLSEAPRFNNQFAEQRFLLWYLAQSYENPAFDRDALKKALDSVGARLIRFCHIKVSLPAYMLMSTEQKRRYCEKVPF